MRPPLPCVYVCCLYAPVCAALHVLVPASLPVEAVAEVRRG